ncbi:hypothetical protein D7D52_35170 [Nocardia yunnanensis]|uniref:Uncharacterized protein n=1 Tax=Nocardia yunnanensis TaxID=2382165 RepID=A0A386ZNE4_9NOCA|nr:hypothetical protein [Nocardia yunnanensis]AYF78209.1 hypothetical protein D7D52_35170 [Nocardia yunnanensis]
MRIPMTASGIRTGIALGALTAALTTGCAASTSGTATPAPNTDRASTTGPMTTSAASAPTPKPGLPAARNGTDLDACADGNCEIQVDGPTTIPTPGLPRIGGSVTIQQISAQAVTAAAKVFGFPAASTAPAGGTLFLNGLTIKVVAVQGSSAVLRLST